MSQDPFFTLKGTCNKIDNIDELSSILRNGKALHNVIYEPTTWEFVKGSTPKLKELVIKNCSFSKTEMKNLYFVSCEFVNCQFVGTSFNNCEFHDCKFVGCNFYKSRLENCYLNPNSILGINKLKHSNIALHIFSELIKNGKQVENINYQFDAEFHYKVYQRYQKIYRLKKDREKVSLIELIYKLVCFCSVFISDFLWMLIAGYGIRSRYVVFSGIAFISLLTYVNYQWGSFINGISSRTEALTRGIDSLYFSIMTVTTLGYGSVTPTNPEGKLLVAFQALTGVIWLTACASVIVKKIVRS